MELKSREKEWNLNVKAVTPSSLKEGVVVALKLLALDLIGSFKKKTQARPILVCLECHETSWSLRWLWNQKGETWQDDLRSNTRWGNFLIFFVCQVLSPHQSSFSKLGFRRTSATKTLAGSSGGDQSGRLNSSHSIIQEFVRFARSDWMGLSGGDQTFPTCKNNFPTC